MSLRPPDSNASAARRAGLLDPEVWRAWLWLGFGLATALWPSNSIEHFIPGALFFAGLDAGIAGATAWFGRSRHTGASRGLEALWSLAMALAIASRPVFSILTLSFVLLLQLVLWWTGLGAIRLATALGSASSSLGLPPSHHDARTPHRIDRLVVAIEIAAGASLLLAALALHLLPGAGAVDRRLALAATLLLVGLLDLARTSGRFAQRPSSRSRGRSESEPGQG